MLEPLTGVGTDLSVTRPITIGADGPQGLSDADRKGRMKDGRLAA